MKKLLLLLIPFLIFTAAVQAQNPILWGTTYLGGTYSSGTIFTYNTSTGTETDLHDFNFIEDGDEPQSSLLRASNGLLYGTTLWGGNKGVGTLFSYNISTGKETVLHSFGVGADGVSPLGSLIQASDSLLYGTTTEGGENNDGIIFSYAISTGKETDLFDFGNGKGRYPSSLLQANDGLIYGVAGGGVDERGTMFSYNISTGKETVLHYFDDTSGYYPFQPLIQASNGLLYGTTYSGGSNSANSNGTIFSYDISLRKYTDIHDFIDGTADGLFPSGSLIQANDSLLYGMTQYYDVVGTYIDGAIFSYNINTGKDTVRHVFGIGTDGADPYSSLFQASNGLLYGVTLRGGINQAGTIFSYNISTDSETVLYDFDAGTGGSYSTLIELDSPTATGLNKFDNLAEILHIYPNPSSSTVHISSKLQREQIINLSLFNTLGQQVWAEDLGKTKHIEITIPVMNLASGVYILKVNSGGSWQEKEVVVAR